MSGGARWRGRADGIVIFLVSILLVLALSARRRSEVGPISDSTALLGARTAVPHLVLAVCGLIGGAAGDLGDRRGFPHTNFAARGRVLLHPDPRELHRSAFSKTSDFLVNYRNSLIVGSISASCASPSRPSAAWSLRGMQLAAMGAGIIPGWALAYSSMFRPLALAGAWFTMARTVGLDNSFRRHHPGPHRANLPMALWLMSVFVREVPLELEEAARIDGASTPVLLWQVVLPLVTPGLAAAAS